MRNVLLVAAALVALCMLPSTAQARWIALAINSSGSGFGEGASELNAKVRALDNCRENTGRQCSIATSVPDGWTVVAVYCGGMPMTGGSQYGEGRAMDVAARKLGLPAWVGTRCRLEDSR